MGEGIVVCGSVAQKPTQGGHTWAILQYVLGFKRLGWDVLFLDRREGANIEFFLDLAEGFGLSGAFALCDAGGRPFIGLSRQQVVERVKRAALLLNINGFLRDEEILGAARRRAFLDIDPGFGQMWHCLGLDDPFRGHDCHVTIGENVGRPDCVVPRCGFDWITTRPPAVLEHWRPVADPVGGWFTSVASWRGAYGPVEYEGKTYGLRAHEFRRFVELPLLTDQRFQLALDIHPADARDVELLGKNRWTLVDPTVAVGDPRAYHAYIQRSKAEFMVAKNMYVQSRSGWFSDRSICYLASGKPVLAQDTGIAGLYPTGEGLLTFNTLEEAAAGVEAISRDYGRHARAARAMAEEYFDSDKVLARLLAKLGVA